MAGIAAYGAPLLGILFWLIAMAYGVTRQYPLLLSPGICMLASGLAAPVLIWAGVRSDRAHACAALRT